MRLTLTSYAALLSGIVFSFSAVAATPSQTICGWVANPTPGNWSILDRTAEWTIGIQGGAQATGVEIPDFGKAWVETNSGSHGYGCACIRATVDAENEQVTNIEKFKVLPIKTCKQDKVLPPHP